MFDLKCIECGTDFKADRKDARFHSDACRKRYSRKSEKTTETPIERKIPEGSYDKYLEKLILSENEKISNLSKKILEIFNADNNV